MNNRHRLLRLLVGGFLALLLTGCLSKPSPEVRFYVLDAVTAGVEEQPGQVVVEISTLRIPQYLDRSQVVTRPMPHRLQVHEFHRWGGNLRKSLTRLLGAELGSRLGTSQILVVPHRSRLPVDFQVNVDIQRFELGPDAQVHLAANWRLVDSMGKSLQAVRSFDRRIAVDNADDMDNVVAAMSDLFMEFSAGVADTIQQHRR